MRPWPEDLLKEDSEDPEVKWPLIVEKKLGDPHEIEPKESESIPFDFIINDQFEQVLVYTCIQNGAKQSGISWNVSTVIDFSREEQQNKHTVMSSEQGAPNKRQGETKPRPQPAQQPPQKIHEQCQPKERPAPSGQPQKKGKLNG